MNTGVSYSMFYDILLNLRECFHGYGRIDDSNAKLDEIIKIICSSYSLALKGNRFGLEYVRHFSISQYDDSNKIALSLKTICENELCGKLFLNDDGTNIFGSNSFLLIQPTEDNIAQMIISEIEKIDFVYLVNNANYTEFDLINECFGHFVRENFRNNKEDAQYMTPYEITKPVLDIIFYMMEKDNYFTTEKLNDFIIMDPTCGVGTLLIETSNKFEEYLKNNVASSEEFERINATFRKNGIIGQDKVDRMVRLSKINTLLLGSNASNVFCGNSIVGESSINDYFEQVDFIFTNPPFGAEFDSDDLDLSQFPILAALNPSTKTLPSELLLLDKSINLLRSGGYLAIVLPDSFFSSKGLYSLYRDYILQKFSIIGVIGLPTVTFAQAGTRTNTCILMLKKIEPLIDQKFFMADSKELGYIVKERAGVPIKKTQGNNEMVKIAELLLKANYHDKIISEVPSVTIISRKDMIGNCLKPSFYAAKRYNTISCLGSSNKTNHKIVKLGELVDFVTIGRKSYMVSDTIKHISVLHINANCTIAFDEVNKFMPVSKGRECYQGELIFSKINPRIPRMAVIPKRDVRLVCSNEFEIMKSKGLIDMQVLCFLLKTKMVMSQIESLTAGTSSSHSRIKREQLADILIPIPNDEITTEGMSRIGVILNDSVNQIYNAEDAINKNMLLLNKIS